MLKHEGIQFQVYKNPDVKCSIVERAHRTIRDKLYKYFTYKNTYRYIDVLPLPFYVLEDLNKTPIDGQFYAEELTPVRISKSTTYKIDKILDRRVRRGSLEYLVKWKGYPQD
jgi:hypothetical protein